MSQLTEIETLLRVVETGSFAGAARELSLSASAVSKQIRRLEMRLGARLLHRTTRALSLTDEGRTVVDRGRAVLGDLEALETELSGRQREPRGQLRISVPQDFGALHLATPLAAFATRYPALSLEIEVCDRNVDLVEEAFDAVVRVGPQRDSRLIQRKLATCELLACASPAYLERRGEPRSAAELREHDCIGYTLAPRWPLREGGRARSWVPPSRLSTNAGWALRELALAGQGIALLPSFLVAEDVRTGRLKSFLADALDSTLEVALLYPERRGMTPKLRCLVEHLSEHFAARPPG